MSEPEAIWIHHPDGRNSFERTTPESAYERGFFLTMDFSDKPILTPAQPSENPVEGKIEAQYCCDICGRTFTKAIALSGHKRSHK